jgi:hypothetical protein
MLGLVIGLVTFFVTTAASEAHKKAKQRMDALFILFFDALRAVQQLDGFLDSISELRGFLASEQGMIRASTPAYFALDPTQLSLSLTGALKGDEVSASLQYFSHWARLKSLLTEYSAQFERIFLGDKAATPDDAAEFFGTVVNLAITAADLRVYALILCKSWLEAHYTFAGREPDVNVDSDARWTAISDLLQELDVARARRGDLLAHAQQPKLPPANETAVPRS